MKFIAQIFAIVITAYVIAMYLPLPWYSVALPSFLFGYLLKSRANFLAGFMAIALLWFLKIWLIESSSDSELAVRVAQIFPVQQKLWLIVVTVVIGGLVGGMASFTGSLLKPRKKKKKSSYY